MKPSKYAVPETLADRVAFQQAIVDWCSANGEVCQFDTPEVEPFEPTCQLLSEPYVQGSRTICVYTMYLLIYMIKVSIPERPPKPLHGKENATWAPAPYITFHRDEDEFDDTDAPADPPMCKFSSYRVAFAFLMDLAKKLDRKDKRRAANITKTPNLYKVPMFLYVEAASEDLALAQAHIASFVATEAIRKTNSDWVQDPVSITKVGETAEIVPDSELPQEAYNKEFLTRVFGEDQAILFMRHANGEAV